MQHIRAQVRQFATALLTEQLNPGRAASAVFLGIFIGIVPIYGFQTLAALGVAFLFKLNKPLIVASTFISNPFLQPLLVIASVDIGFILRHGYYRPFALTALSGSHMKDELLTWFLGSLILGVVVGGVGAGITALVMRLRKPANPGLLERIHYVDQTFAESESYDRNYVRWKLRLDRIFDVLDAEFLGNGTVVDLGCGYGAALSFVSFRAKERRLIGCDLNERRIAVARKAFTEMNAEVTVGDIREFQLPEAGLILILDVLQYLSSEDQLSLLKRCCEALEPDGMLIFRVQDRKRGLRSRITMLFDWILFRYERVNTRPLILSATQYQKALEESGMLVSRHHFVNRLPLAHILFRATKPVAEIAS